MSIAKFFFRKKRENAYFDNVKSSVKAPDYEVEYNPELKDNSELVSDVADQTIDASKEQNKNIVDMHKTDADTQNQRLDSDVKQAELREETNKKQSQTYVDLAEEDNKVWETQIKESNKGFIKPVDVAGVFNDPEGSDNNNNNNQLQPTKPPTQLDDGSDIDITKIFTYLVGTIVVIALISGLGYLFYEYVINAEDTESDNEWDDDNDDNGDNEKYSGGGIFDNSFNRTDINGSKL